MLLRLKFQLSWIQKIKITTATILLVGLFLVPNRSYSQIYSQENLTADMAEQGEILRNLVLLNSVDNAVVLKAINFLRKYPYEEINEVLIYSINQELYRAQPEARLIRVMLLALKERATVRDRRAIDKIQLNIFNAELDQKILRQDTRNLDKLTEDIISDLLNIELPKSKRAEIRLNHPLKELVLAVIHKETEKFATLADAYIRADGKPLTIQKLFQIFSDPKFKSTFSAAELKVRGVQEMVSQLTGVRMNLLGDEKPRSDVPAVEAASSSVQPTNASEPVPKAESAPGRISNGQGFVMPKMLVRQVELTSDLQCQKLFQ